MDQGPGMLEIVAATAGVKLGALLVGGIMTVVFLSWLDRRAGIDWKADIVPDIKADAQAAATYYGLRVAGALVAVAVAIS